MWREDHHLFLFQDNFNYINQPSSGSRGLISTASSGPVQGKMPPAIRWDTSENPHPEYRIIINLFPREFLKTLDDQEWQSSLFTLLQNQTFNQVTEEWLVVFSAILIFVFQVEVDLFELMCKVLDQNLFAQVDWARNSYYFKELKVGQVLQLFPSQDLHERFSQYFPAVEPEQVVAGWVAS